MNYKIKVKNEDFIVKEKTSLKITDSGDYSVFLLVKRGWNTDDLIRRISNLSGIKYSHFSYGGRKDRHSVSEQLITIKGDHKDLSFDERDFSLSFMGYSNEPMKPEYILSNSFEIIVRDIKREMEGRIRENIERIKKYGFLNYFDEQRFRSYIESDGFVGECILKRHYNGALKMIMTSIRDDDSKEEKERKRFFFEHWGDWDTCLKNSRTTFEKRVFAHLRERKRDFINILRSIERSELSMFFSVYQSFLFNEVLKRLIKESISEVSILHIGPTDIYIPTRLEADFYNYLKGLYIPLAGPGMAPDERVSRIYNEVFQWRGIRPSMFNLRKIRKAYYKSHPRSALVFPSGLEYSFDMDEIYQQRLRVKLRFDLPKGSYATMMIKQIFVEKEVFEILDK